MPPPDGPWVARKFVPNAWTHDAYPRHVVWKPEDDVVVVSQLAASTPKEAGALRVGQAALGASAAPMQVGSYPLSLRLSMTARSDLQLELPHGCFRCRPLWPPEGHEAYLEVVEGVQVELRISGTSVGQGVRFYAEAFAGRAHQTRKGKRRLLLYTADARHVLLLPNPERLKRFTARLMDRLVAFAYFRQDVGLEVDHRRLTGRRLGVVQACPDIDDVEFAIRLPPPGGMEKYVGSYVTP